MKNLSLFVSAVAILSASSAFAAIDCATLPSCGSLGYNDIVAQCPKSSAGEDMVVKCPFDTSKGKCIFEAAVGEIAYFTKTPDTNSGWLRCDGQTIAKAKYPDLYAFLGQQFCTADHGGTCGTDVGRVPDYRGYFLRVYAGATYGSYVSSTFSTYANVVNSSLTAPQKQGLPNITGKGIPSEDYKGTLKTSLSKEFGDSRFFEISGALFLDCKDNLTKDSNFLGMEGSDGNNCRVNLDASVQNSIYDSSTGVTPPNYAVYAYIYAGKVVK